MPHRKKPESEGQTHETEVEAHEPQIDETDEAASLRQRIAELEQQILEANNERLRAYADLQNFRKRTQTEMSQFRLLATESLVMDILPVLDNFERSLSHLQANADPAKVVEGIRLIERQLRTVLDSQNVKRIEALGKAFDPDLHEAVSMGPSEEHEDETVIVELEPGYRMGEKVIRPARVKVAKNS